MYRIVAIQPFGCNTTINFISFQVASRLNQRVCDKPRCGLIIAAACVAMSLTCTARLCLIPPAIGLDYELNTYSILSADDVTRLGLVRPTTRQQLGPLQSLVVIRNKLPGIIVLTSIIIIIISSSSSSNCIRCPLASRHRHSRALSTTWN